MRPQVLTALNSIRLNLPCSFLEPHSQGFPTRQDIAEHIVYRSIFLVEHNPVVLLFNRWTDFSVASDIGQYQRYLIHNGASFVS